MNRNLRITVNQRWTKVYCIREESQPLPDRRIVGGNFYMKSYMKRKTLPFRLGYIEVARLPDGDNFRRPHTLPSSPRGFDAATLSALAVRALQDRNRACKRLSSNAPLRKYADRPSPPRKPESKRESCLC